MRNTVQIVGESQELVDFCTAVQPRLVRALTLQCGDVGVAEELAQETLAVVWLKWGRVREMAAPQDWVFRVAFNLSKSWLRRRRAESRALRRAAADIGTMDAVTGEGAEVRQRLQRLPARQRQALVLRYYCDLPVDRAAEVMACAPGTVKALTHQGIKSLRDLLGVELQDRSR